MSSQSPQDLIEQALSLATCSDCVVIADDVDDAGPGTRSPPTAWPAPAVLTVIAIDRRSAGAAVGVVSRSGVVPKRWNRWSGRPRRRPRRAPWPRTPSRWWNRRKPRNVPSGRPGWDDPPEGTGIGVLEGFAGQLGETLREAAAGGRKLYGFAEHDLTSTFLGTSTGVRLRHDQPSGKVELNAKSDDLSRSAWAGEATRDFAGVDVAALDRGLAERLEWAKRRVELPAGRDAAAAHRHRGPAHLPVLVGRGQEALDGRTVFSKPGGGTQVGESCPTCRSRCAAIRIPASNDTRSS